jgi:hypothetical protein
VDGAATRREISYNDGLPNERRWWDPDSGIVYIIVMLTIIFGFMLWMVNQPNP